MYKATQDACHRQRREGSFSTMPSARGVNLLGWEEAEEMSPEDRRIALGRRVGQIQTFLAAHKKTVDKKEKWRLIKECSALVEQIRKLKPGRRVAIKDLPQHFIAVAAERLTPAEFRVWMAEARQRAQDEAHSSQAHDQLSVNAGTARTDGAQPRDQGEAS